MLNNTFIRGGAGPRLAFMEKADPQQLAETLVALANTEGGTILIGLTPEGKQGQHTIRPDDVQQAMKAADDLYNPPVVVDKWEEAEISASRLPIDDEDELATEDKAKSNGKVESQATAKNSDDSKADSKADDKTDSDKTADAKANDAKAEQEGAKAATAADNTKNKAESKTEDKSDSKADASNTDGDDKKAADDEDVEDTSSDKFTVYAIRVPRSIELHAMGDGRVLIRSGARNRPLGGQEILRLASAKSTGAFESEIVPGATRDDFSRKMIDEYLEKRAERTKRPYNGKVDDLLTEIGAITSDGQPTVTGVLLFCEYPQQWLPQSSVVFAKFVGTTPRGESGLAGYTRREELTGPLPRLIEASWNLIWSEMAVSAVVKGLEREEKTEYPQFAVREAIVNAICHRDYRLRGRRVELRMYSDRLEVISPGGLPGFITIENIKDEHFSRNPRIVNGLFQWGYIEELGLGIDRMIEVMEQAGHRPPTFDARPYSFAVTLLNEREKPKPPEWVRNTNHRQARALQYIREQGSITNREYRGLCEGVSAETLRLDLVDMVEKGILIKVGSKKGTHYILK
ncbi:putative DNA binding domain-containing protein [Phototrophicus methaneseepsis]|uniref:Putative DNA binding domain-containing protein n=1 Tax=Phototrophicus methaneseepsis TaxID=2710758 RepID=A0A7S8E766_9CHLR|nr:ATP-binding protein [Phototrophicus methaneseepsis]QPC81633.1 putative DNA binding domain-containing protein [Phototrophicus methaneseepsis]